MRKQTLKNASVFSLSLLLGGMSSLMPVAALEILANNYSMTATANNMSAQELCQSAGIVSTDPRGGVTWKCSSGNLNTTVPGKYSINITATDGSETKNKTIQVRVTKAKTNSAPVLSLTTGEVTIAKGSGFNAASYIAGASDAEDGNLAGSVKISGSVNTNKVGTYTVTYSVSDSQGLTATLKLTVHVVENASGNTGGTGSPAQSTQTGGNGGSGSHGTGITSGGSVSSNGGALLPDTADLTASVLGGMATLAIGGIALVAKKKKEVTE